MSDESTAWSRFVNATGRGGNVDKVSYEEYDC